MKSNQIKKISWTEINRIWKQELWPNRQSSIDPISYMAYQDGHDMTIGKYKPTFWGKYIDNMLVGVNSGHRTADRMYRSRGLWVHPDYRGQGIGIELLAKTLDQARKEGCWACWSFPRKSSWKTYKSAGFERTSKWTMDGEYGPNCYCIKDLLAY